MDTMTLLIINFAIFLGIYLIVKAKPEWFLGEEHRRQERARKRANERTKVSEIIQARPGERGRVQASEKQNFTPTLMAGSPVMSSHAKNTSMNTNERKFM
jgi:hypothetical protein